MSGKCKITTFRVLPHSLYPGEKLSTIDVEVLNTSGEKAEISVLTANAKTGEVYQESNWTITRPGKSAHHSLIAYFCTFRAHNYPTTIKCTARYRPYGGGDIQDCDSQTQLITCMGPFCETPPPTPTKFCAPEGVLCVPTIYSGCCNGLTKDALGICRKPTPTPPKPPTPETCPKGERYNIHFYQECAPGYTKKFEVSTQGYYCQCDAAPPTPPRVCEEGKKRCYMEAHQICKNNEWITFESCAPKPPTPETCPKGERYNIHFYQECAPGYTKKFEVSTQGYYCQCDAAPPTPPPPTPPPPTPPPPTPPPPEICPKGTIYTRGLFESCDPGYYQGDLPGGEFWGKGAACICAEGYEPPHEDEEDKPGITDMFAYIPALIIAGVIIAALGLFKR